MERKGKLDRKDSRETFDCSSSRCVQDVAPEKKRRKRRKRLFRTVDTWGLALFDFALFSHPVARVSVCRDVLRAPYSCIIRRRIYRDLVVCFVSSSCLPYRCPIWYGKHPPPYRAWFGGRRPASAFAGTNLRRPHPHSLSQVSRDLDY